MDHMDRISMGDMYEVHGNPLVLEKLHGTCKNYMGLCCFVHGYPVPIHLVNHMKAGCAYAPMHGIQFSETTTEKYSTEQKF